MAAIAEIAADDAADLKVTWDFPWVWSCRHIALPQF